MAQLAHTPITDDEVKRAQLVDFSVRHDDSEVSVGTQLLWKLRAMIARGALRADDRLPSVRELAAFSGVNVNTARAAYAALEAEGAIASEQGRGTFVTGHEQDWRALDAVVRETLERAGIEGIDVAQLAEALWAASADESIELPKPPLASIDPTLEEVDLRLELRGQIERIEAELAAYAWQDRKRAPVQRVAKVAPIARVASLEDLQRTRDELVERLIRLRGAAERRGGREQRVRAHVEDMLEHPDAHRWETVTSADSGAGGRVEWRVVPRFGPLGAILGWWRVRASSE